MARIRTIKPDFWTDEKVVVLSPLARLLFIGLWNFVDDEGRAEYSPRRLKMQILPADAVDVSELLGEILREGLISVYCVDGKEYFTVNGFSKHQKVDHRSQSKIPTPENPPESPRRKGMEKEGNGKGREKEEEKSSETNVSGASAPTVVSFDPSRALFSEGLKTLSAITGRPEASLRPQVGRWLRLTGNDHAAVLAIIRRAQEQSVIDPVAWIERSMRPKDPDAEIYRGVL